MSEQQYPSDGTGIAGHGTFFQPTHLPPDQAEQATAWVRKHIDRRTLDLAERMDDMKFFAERIDKTCIERLEKFVSADFAKLDYTDAIAALDTLDAACAKHRGRLLSLAVPDPAMTARAAALTGLSLSYSRASGPEALIDAVIALRRCGGKNKNA